MRTIEVNLLPAEYIPENPLNLRNTIFLVFSILTLCFLAFDVHEANSRQRLFEGEKQILLKKIDQSRQLKADIDKLRAKTALLKKRSELVTEIIEQRTTWSSKINEIYAQIPDDALWLSELTLVREVIKVAAPRPADRKKPATPKPEVREPEVDKERISLEIRGDAIDIPTVAEFIFRLESLGHIENTRFQRVGEAQRRGRPVMSFELTAQVNLKGDIEL